jgi:CRP-like cAMP-binding protein
MVERKSKGTYTLRRHFPSLDEAVLRHLESRASVVRLRKSQNLFLAGDVPRSIYAVANGCLKIVRESPEGDSVITRIAQPGDIVGIREVFGGFNYSRTSVALRDSEVFAIDAASVTDLMAQHPALALQFMKIFSTELARLEKRIEANLYTPAHVRVGAVIYELFLLFAAEGEMTFEPPLNRRDIADLADVTPETVSRAIAELRQSGAIETQGAMFRILDPDALMTEM